MTKTNSFATKSDLNKLKKHVDKRFEHVDKRFEHVDKRFEQVDKRFEQVDKRFEQVDKRFSWFRKELNADFDLKFKDAFRKFEHKWQQIIDPVLKEIEKHREKEIIAWEQNKRTQKLLFKIARKVGIDPTD